VGEEDGEGAWGELVGWVSWWVGWGGCTETEPEIVVGDVGGHGGYVCGGVVMFWGI
jgi:hypothetical protein